MARTIYCTMIGVPAMSDHLGPRTGGFEDLVPWADPYIAALIEKLRRAADFAASMEEEDSESDGPTGELPPPLNGDGEQDDAWQADWWRK